MEREMRCQGTTFLLLAQRLPAHHKVHFRYNLGSQSNSFNLGGKNQQQQLNSFLYPQRIARRNPSSSHLHGVPQQLPMDPWSHWWWILQLNRAIVVSLKTLSCHGWGSFFLFFIFLLFWETHHPLSPSFTTLSCPFLCCDSLFYRILLTEQPKTFYLKNFLHIETSQIQSIWRLLRDCLELYQQNSQQVYLWKPQVYIQNFENSRIASETNASSCVRCELCIKKNINRSKYDLLFVSFYFVLIRNF